MFAQRHFEPRSECPARLPSASPPTERMHDLDRVAGLQHMRGMPAARHDLAIDLHSAIVAVSPIHRHVVRRCNMKPLDFRETIRAIRCRMSARPPTGCFHDAAPTQIYSRPRTHDLHGTLPIQ